jgi:hypothetical protein
VAELSSVVWANCPCRRSVFAHFLCVEAEKEMTVLVSFLYRYKAAESGFFCAKMFTKLIVTYRKNYIFANRMSQNSMFIYF